MNAIILPLVLLLWFQFHSLLLLLLLLLFSRWIRLLFGREFPLPSVLEVWDAVFADGVSLVDYMCVAMLMHIREVCECFSFSFNSIQFYSVVW